MGWIIDFFSGTDMECVKTGVGLLFLIFVNIILGGLQAKITEEYDWGKMKQGVLKGVLVAVCVTIVYYVGLLNQSIIAISIGEVEMNLATAVTTMVTASFVWYAYQVVQKLAVILNVTDKISIKEKGEENGTTEPQQKEEAKEED